MFVKSLILSLSYDNLFKGRFKINKIGLGTTIEIYKIYSTVSFYELKRKVIIIIMKEIKNNEGKGMICFVATITI